jgi:hypothetical protein
MANSNPVSLQSDYQAEPYSIPWSVHWNAQSLHHKYIFIGVGVQFYYQNVNYSTIKRIISLDRIKQTYHLYWMSFLKTLYSIAVSRRHKSVPKFSSEWKSSIHVTLRLSLHIHQRRQHSRKVRECGTTCDITCMFHLLLDRKDKSNFSMNL